MVGENNDSETKNWTTINYLLHVCVCKFVFTHLWKNEKISQIGILLLNSHNTRKLKDLWLRLKV